MSDLVLLKTIDGLVVQVPKEGDISLISFAKLNQEIEVNFNSHHGSEAPEVSFIEIRTSEMKGGCILKTIPAKPGFYSLKVRLNTAIGDLVTSTINDNFIRACLMFLNKQSPNMVFKPEVDTIEFEIPAKEEKAG